MEREPLVDQVQRGGRRVQQDHEQVLRRWPVSRATRNLGFFFLNFSGKDRPGLSILNKDVTPYNNVSLLVLMKTRLGRVDNCPMAKSPNSGSPRPGLNWRGFGWAGSGWALAGPGRAWVNVGRRGWARLGLGLWRGLEL